MNTAEAKQVGKRYIDFTITGRSYEARKGAPNERFCAIGNMAVIFTILEYKLWDRIYELLSNECANSTYPDELSFLDKICLLKSLMEERDGDGHSSREEGFNKLFDQLMVAKDLYEEIIFAHDKDALTSSYIQDVADFISALNSHVEQLLLQP